MRVHQAVDDVVVEQADEPRDEHRQRSRDVDDASMMLESNQAHSARQQQVPLTNTAS